MLWSLVFVRGVAVIHLWGGELCGDGREVWEEVAGADGAGERWPAIASATGCAGRVGVVVGVGVGCNEARHGCS